MTGAERREEWLAVLGKVIARLREVGLPIHVSAVSSVVAALQAAEHEAMDNATDEAARDRAYERHRALSAIHRALLPPANVVPEN